MLRTKVVARLSGIHYYWFTVTVNIAKCVYCILALHLSDDGVPVVYFPAT